MKGFKSIFQGNFIPVLVLFTSEISFYSETIFDLLAIIHTNFFLFFLIGRSALEINVSLPKIQNAVQSILSLK